MKALKFPFMAFALIIVLMTAGCSKSPYEKAMDYLHELSEDVTSATDMESYDVVYNKIVNLKSDPLILGLTGLTDNEKREIAKEMISLTNDALIVKAILNVKSSDMKLTSQDMKALCEICKQNNVNPITVEYSEIRTIVKDYFNNH